MGTWRRVHCDIFCLYPWLLPRTMGILWLSPSFSSSCSAVQEIGYLEDTKRNIPESCHLATGPGKSSGCCKGVTAMAGVDADTMVSFCTCNPV